MKIYLLQYSLTGGVIIALFMVLSMWLLEQGFSYSLCELIGYLSMLLGFSTIYLALKKVRDTHLNGKISFGKAFKIALLMLALVALIVMETSLLRRCSKRSLGAIHLLP